MAATRRSFLVLDIETVLDPELPLPQPGGEASSLPPPPHHQIVVIGVLWLDANHRVQRLGVIGDGKGEAAMLADFAHFLDERAPDLVTWNGRGFDLPVIAARCLRHGVVLRHYYGDREVRYRFSTAGHYDVMDYLADFGAARPAKLDTAARLVGMPGKVGVDGKDIGPMIHAGRLADVQAYCLTDVVQTAAVFLRLELVRGALSREAYLDAMRSLLAQVDGDPRLAALLPGTNRARLLLEEGGAGDAS